MGERPGTRHLPSIQQPNVVENSNSTETTETGTVSTSMQSSGMDMDDDMPCLYPDMYSSPNNEQILHLLTSQSVMMKELEALHSWRKDAEIQIAELQEKWHLQCGRSCVSEHGGGDKGGKEQLLPVYPWTTMPHNPRQQHIQEPVQYKHNHTLQQQETKHMKEELKTIETQNRLLRRSCQQMTNMYHDCAKKLGARSVRVAELENELAYIVKENTENTENRTQLEEEVQGLCELVQKHQESVEQLKKNISNVEIERDLQENEKTRYKEKLSALKRSFSTWQNDVCYQLKDREGEFWHSAIRTESDSWPEVQKNNIAVGRYENNDGAILCGRKEGSPRCIINGRNLFKPSAEDVDNNAEMSQPSISNVSAGTVALSNQLSVGDIEMHNNSKDRVDATNQTTGEYTQVPKSVSCTQTQQTIQVECSTQTQSPDTSTKILLVCKNTSCTQTPIICKSSSSVQTSLVRKTTSSAQTQYGCATSCGTQTLTGCCHLRYIDEEALTEYYSAPFTEMQPQGFHRFIVSADSLFQGNQDIRMIVTHYKHLLTDDREMGVNRITSDTHTLLSFLSRVKLDIPQGNLNLTSNYSHELKLRYNELLTGANAQGLSVPSVTMYVDLSDTVRWQCLQVESLLQHYVELWKADKETASRRIHDDILCLLQLITASREMDAQSSHQVPKELKSQLHKIIDPSPYAHNLRKGRAKNRRKTKVFSSKLRFLKSLMS